jgi:hypothetical protein
MQARRPIGFSNIEALWHDHLFEPFLRWVGEELVPADRIGLYRGKGVTWATLLRPNDGANPPNLSIVLWS